MNKPVNVLIVEDSEDDTRLALRALRRGGFEPAYRRVQTAAEFKTALAGERWDAVISDFSMPGFTGMDALGLCRATGLDIPFILISGTAGEEIAVNAMKAGANDYIVKMNLPRLSSVLERELHEAANRATQRRAEETQREATQLLDNIVENIPTAVQLKSVRDDFRILMWNKAAEVLYGVSRDAAIGRNVHDLWPESDADRMHAADLALASTKNMQDFPNRLAQTRDRGDIRVHMRKVALCDAGGNATHLLVIADDITGRKQADERIRRLNRVYAVLSGINSAIVRIRERGELFRETCRIAVSEGGFFVARVIEFASNGCACIAATSEVDARLFQKIVDEYNMDPGQSGSMLAVALRGGQPLVSNDVAADARILNRAALTKEGNYSLALLPMIVEQRIAGVVILRTREAGMFDDAEMRLLLELVANLSFALEHIGKEAKVQRLTRVYAVMSGINSLIVRVRDRDELFREACRIVVAHGNFAMSWIGAFDPATQDVTPVAWAGEAAEELTRAKSSARDDTPRGTGAVGQSIRERRPIFNNNILTQSFGGPRLKEILRLGFQSHITLPLFEDQAIVATLTLYTKEQGFFDEDELRLLTQLAGDISFALRNISRQQQLDKLARIRAVSSEINAAIVRIHERNALLEETCRIVFEHGKLETIWIGAIDQDGQRVQPIAWKGFSEETARAVDWAGISASKDSLAEAIQTRKASVRNYIDGEQPGGRLRGEALKRGCRSSVCLPLVVDDRVAALVVLFAPETGFFDKAELALFDEVASDISFALQAIERQKKLEYLSYYDVLTGLANRALFLERVAQYMRSAAAGGHTLALFLIDLERFKSINDSLGRSAGDALLRQVAEWLTHSIGDANLLARVGPDQFAMVLPEVRQEGNLARLLEKTMAAFLEHPFHLNDAVFRVAVKLGAALYPDDGADAETLLRNAEAALKKAKASGDRYLFYARKMTAAVAGNLTLENQLREALDKGEFVLHYQPKVSLESGKLTSAEALIRWNDPRTGLVPPGRFIPVLEEIGLINDVGRWALRQALADYVRWRAAGLPAVRIAVNVSPLQLRSRGFIEEIRQVLNADPHAEGGLELELTESLIMEDVKHSIASLQAIRAMGVRIAIDDFGTGFSSLSYLAKLPVDTLKIDRSFVNEMTVAPEGLGLVSTIISLAHSLTLTVVAEGVETEEQSRLLRLLRCDEMQGFLFSKPVPADLFEARFLAPAAAPEALRARIA